MSGEQRQLTLSITPRSSTATKLILRIAINANFSIPFDPSLDPSFLFEETGQQTRAPAGRVFYTYYALVNYIFLLECDTYLPHEDCIVECFDYLPEEICVVIMIEDLKLRLSVLGWIAEQELGELVESSTAHAEKWTAKDYIVMTELGYHLANVNAHRYQDDGHAPTQIKASVLACGNWNDGGTAQQPSKDLHFKRYLAKIDIVYNGMDVGRTSLIRQQHAFATELLWNKNSTAALTTSPSSGWVTDPSDDGVFLVIRLLDDKDARGQPLNWGWIGIAMETLVWQLAKDEKWQVFEAKIRMRNAKALYLKVTSEKIDRLPDGSAALSQEEFGKVPFKKIGVRDIENGANGDGSPNASNSAGTSR